MQASLKTGSNMHPNINVLETARLMNKSRILSRSENRL